METILDALQEGRLFELPDNDKADSLQFLSHIIEAFPEIPAGTDIVKAVMKREDATNTALGKGWACPHASVPFDEDLMCVIGWSPDGINYGAKDGKAVTLVIMYLVPQNQRNHYLREISTLARVLESSPGIEKMEEAKDLNDIRNYLLDLIDSTKKPSLPDARARMIRLQEKPAAAIAFSDLANLIVEPVTIISGPNLKHVALTQNQDLMKLLDSMDGLVKKLETDGMSQNAGWRVLRKSTAMYQGQRIVYDCIAVKVDQNLSKKPILR